MCELLALSANTPTDMRFSFHGLARRGGATGEHADGWGHRAGDLGQLHHGAPAVLSGRSGSRRLFSVRSSRVEQTGRRLEPALVYTGTASFSAGKSKPTVMGAIFDAARRMFRSY